MQVRKCLQAQVARAKKCLLCEHISARTGCPLQSQESDCLAAVFVLHCQSPSAWVLPHQRLVIGRSALFACPVSRAFDRIVAIRWLPVRMPVMRRDPENPARWRKNCNQFPKRSRPERQPATAAHPSRSLHNALAVTQDDNRCCRLLNHHG